MVDCCTNTAASIKQCCPSCDKSYSQVSNTTVLQHIKQPWDNNVGNQIYYFCQNPNCTVVYYGDKIFYGKDLRLDVGLKHQEKDSAPLCYCFDITYTQYAERPSLKQYVLDKTKNKQCSCQSRNPSGKCCLKDFS